MSPFRILFLLFLIIPLLEIYLLIKVGGLIGPLPTIFLVVLTAVLGAVLLRQQGFSTLQRVQQELSQGMVPAGAMLEGVMLLFSGALLLTPGFFTDAIGFLLLMPVFRRWAIYQMMRRMVVTPFGETSGGFSGHSGNTAQGRTLEGEFQRREDD